MLIYTMMAAAVQTACAIDRERARPAKTVATPAPEDRPPLGWKDLLVVVGFALVVAVFMVGAWKLGLL